MALPHLCFIIETGTDVRLVEGLAERFNLTLLARQSKEGVMISQHTAVPIKTIVGPASRTKFATKYDRRTVFEQLLKIMQTVCENPT